MPSSKDKVSSTTATTIKPLTYFIFIEDIVANIINQVQEIICNNCEKVDLL